MRKTVKRGLGLVSFAFMASSFLAYAALPQGSVAQGFSPDTAYERPSAPVQISGLDAFIVDAAHARQVQVALRGPGAAVVIWPVGTSVPETGIRLVPPAKGSAGYRAGQAGAVFTNMPAEGLPELVDLPPFASIAKISVNAPANYTLDLSKAQSGARAFMVAVRDGSEIRMKVSLAELSVSANARQVVEARLYDASSGVALTGFKVEARLKEGNGKATLPVLLRDDGRGPDSKAGDGVYSAVLPPGRPGAMADVKVDASGVWQGLPLHRVAQTAFGRQGGLVSISSVGAASITRGEDGLVESLSLPVRLAVGRAGRYRVQAVLTGKAGKGEILVAYASTETNLAKSQEVALTFPGNTLAEAGAEPPFAVRDVSVVNLDKVEVEDSIADGGTVGGFMLADCPAPEAPLHAPAKAPVP